MSLLLMHPVDSEPVEIHQNFVGLTIALIRVDGRIVFGFAKNIGVKTMTSRDY